MADTLKTEQRTSKQDYLSLKDKRKPTAAALFLIGRQKDPSLLHNQVSKEKEVIEKMIKNLHLRQEGSIHFFNPFGPEIDKTWVSFCFPHMNIRESVSSLIDNGYHIYKANLSEEAGRQYQEQVLRAHGQSPQPNRDLEQKSQSGAQPQ